ncbi:hypothetical protein EXN66_Car007836 [Channa argus]|uniref:Uncharacterized protein n=1 Tax=Channa argus TaxID=215402 RepID=A0A6G1PPC8_CHAAH|nr:hypothetical protein EXN66_Car007836 [Channa argus]
MNELSQFSDLYIERRFNLSITWFSMLFKMPRIIWRYLMISICSSNSQSVSLMIISFSFQFILCAGCCLLM